MHGSDEEPEEAAGTSGPRDTVVIPPAAEGGDSEALALVGRVISGRYRVIELIAAGGMGAVYRGEHVHMRHGVAIKVLLPHTEGLPQLVKRFEREAIAGGHVRHPNVAAATDFGRDGGAYFLVLELVKGETLAERIAKGPVPPERAAQIARELAQALEAVHAAGIVHRDVKPKNIVLSEDDGSVKLLDFGFAKLQELPDEHAQGTALTAADVVLGTVPYMAPEIAGGMSALDGRADLYALGIIFYEMLAGKHPFESRTTPELFAAHRFATPPPIAERSGVTVPPGLEAVVMALLAKDPAERFQSATAVIRALDAALGEPAEEGRSRDAPSPPPRVGPGEEGGERPGPPGEAGESPASVRAEERAGSTLGLSGTGARWLALAAGGLLLVCLALVIALSGPSPAEDAERAEPTTDDDGEEAAPEPEPGPRYAKAVAAEVDGRDAAAWRTQLVGAPRVKHWLDGAKAFVALAKTDPTAFDAADVREAAIAVAVGIATGPAEHADPVFEALATGLGTVGHELLFELVRAKGSTEAARRAASLLASNETIRETSPAVALAYDLRRLPCPDKAALFERAGKIGDRHVLAELLILRHAKCRTPDHSCCFRDDEALAAAIAALDE